MRLYLDTNVIVDIIEDRDARSADLVLRAFACEHELVLSSLLVRELTNIGHSLESTNVLQWVLRKNKIIFVDYTPEEVVAARALPTHLADAVHYVLARRHADALVTRNVRDFPFTDIPVGKPEEF